MNELKYQQNIFSSGYHDAANTVQNKWNNPENFWGFAKNIGEKIKDPADILDIHPNKIYAYGWLAGFNDMNLGEYKGNSEKAWNIFLVRKEMKIYLKKITKHWKILD